MSDEQLDLLLKDIEKNLFHLRLQTATERLETPSEIQQGQAGHRPDQDDPAASASWPAAAEAASREGDEPMADADHDRDRRRGQQRRTLVGVVTSDKMNKTRRVEIERLVKHPQYGKYIKRRTVCHVHDENNESHIGDMVEIMETRPLSKIKRWRLVRVVDARAPAGPVAERACRRQPTESSRPPEASAAVPSAKPRAATRREGGRHDSDVYVPRRGRQHRGQGVHVHQGAGRHAGGATPAWAT